MDVLRSWHGQKRHRGGVRRARRVAAPVFRRDLEIEDPATAWSAVRSRATTASRRPASPSRPDVSRGVLGAGREDRGLSVVQGATRVDVSSRSSGSASSQGLSGGRQALRRCCAHGPLNRLTRRQTLGAAASRVPGLLLGTRRTGIAALDTDDAVGRLHAHARAGGGPVLRRAGEDPPQHRSPAAPASRCSCHIKVVNSKTCSRSTTTRPSTSALRRQRACTRTSPRRATVGPDLAAGVQMTDAKGSRRVP